MLKVRYLLVAFCEAYQARISHDTQSFRSVSSSNARPVCHQCLHFQDKLLYSGPLRSDFLSNPDNCQSDSCLCVADGLLDLFAQGGSQKSRKGLKVQAGRYHVAHHLVKDAVSWDREIEAERMRVRTAQPLVTEHGAADVMQ